MTKKFSVGIRVVTAAVTVALTFLFASSDIFAAGTCKVGDGTCNIRSTSSTSGSKVASVTEGTELTVESKTTGSDGNTWYKVSVNGSTGYIRADLVKDVSGDIPSESSSSSSTNAAATTTESSSTTSSTTDTQASSTTTTEAANTTVNPSTVLTAKTTDNVSVREGASTKTNKKASASNGTEVSVTGEATDSEGKLWYQVSYPSGDSTVTGFIRSDFLEVLTTAEETQEEETVEDVADEEAEVTAAVNKDYEVVYEANSEGVEEWYLYDHIKGTKQSINNIYAVMEQSQEYAAADNKELKTMKIVVIAMAVVIVALIITVTVLIFKLRDAQYDDYEDDYEEDNYEEEEEEDDYEEPRRRGGRARRRGRQDDYEDEEDDYDDEEEEEEPRPARKAAKSSGKRPLPSRGKIDVDDDMEFEFLDLDE